MPIAALSAWLDVLDEPAQKLQNRQRNFAIQFVVHELCAPFICPMESAKAGVIL